MEQMKIALARRVKSLRKGMALTQEQLAEKASVSIQHVGEIERGKGNPTLASLYQLAQALGVTVQELLDVDADTPDEHELTEKVMALLTQSGELQRRKALRLLIELLR